jgi:hypothetical protein
MKHRCWAAVTLYVKKLVHTAACSFAAEDLEAAQHDEISLKVHDRIWPDRFLS